MSNSIIVRCMNGFALTVVGSNIVVSTKRTEEIYPIAKIQSFTLKEPKGLSAGTITFRTAQTASASIAIGFGIGAEQNFFFQKAELQSAIALRDYVSSYEEQKYTQVPNGMVVCAIQKSCKKQKKNAGKKCDPDFLRPVDIGSSLKIPPAPSYLS